jgi:hypothetical protein
MPPFFNFLVTGEMGASQSVFEWTKQVIDGGCFNTSEFSFQRLSVVSVVVCSWELLCNIVTHLTILFSVWFE